MRSFQSLKTYQNIIIYLFTFFILPLSLVFAWRLKFIQYNLGSFDLFLVAENLALLIVLLLCSIIALLIKPSLITLITFLYVVYLGPLIANSPFYIHRDVFLHIPYSMCIAEKGHILEVSDRIDVISYPFSFIFYAIILSISGILDPRIVGLTLAAPYALTFSIPLVLLARAILPRGADHQALASSIVLFAIVLPFISRFAPAPGFPHRYHFAFIQTTLLLYLFARHMEHEFTTREMICMVLLYLYLVFTHPFYSLFTFIAVFACSALNIIRKNTKYKKMIAISVILTLVFAAHNLYLTHKRILMETYRFLLILPSRFTDFVETSLPVRVESVSGVIVLISLIARHLWRVYVIFTAFYAASLYLLMLKRGVKYLSLSLAVASLVLIPMLVTSFLWWERSLTFIALSIFCALCEIHSLGEKKNGTTSFVVKVNNRILPILFLLAIVLSPLARWERYSLADNWQGVEKEVFLKTLSLHADAPEIYMGAGSAVDYTYYRVYLYPDFAPRSKTIFDPVRGALTMDVSKLSGVYAVSVRDPDFELLDFKALVMSRGIVWVSGFSYVFWKS